MCVKYKELAKKLVKLGWRLKKQGKKHEIWTDGEFTIPVPRHREINENTAKSILNTVGKMKGRRS